MRIGFFLDSYKPYISGVVHSVDSFASGLRALGHEVYIFGPEAPGTIDEPYIIRVPSFHTLFQPPNHYLPYPVSPTLARILRDLSLDVIHTHHMFLLGRLGAQLARKMDLPLIHTYHTLLTEYTHYVPVAQGLAKKSVISITKRYCNGCDGIVAPTLPVESVLRGYGVESPIRVIPTGIDLSKYQGLDRADCRRSLGLQDSDYVLICVARLTKEKNPEFLIEAFSKIYEKRPNAKLLMLGAGALESQLRDMVKARGLEGSLTLTGAIPYSEVPKYYMASDLFVFASITETQAIVIPEAMAAGNPAVAVGINGVVDMIRDGVDGYLTALDQEEFTSKVIRIMDDRNLRDSMSKEALKSSYKYSSQNSAKSLEQFYCEVIDDYRYCANKK